MNAQDSAILVVALDFAAAAPALYVAEKVRNVVSWVKVGLELFSAEGPHVVHALKQFGFDVFLDLKLHDIPNTVQGAVLAAARLHVDMLTLHVTGGERMIRAAVDAINNSPRRPLLFGVTVLTSMEPGEFFTFGARSAKTLAGVAKKLALRAQAWGMDGVVCSGREVREIRRATGLRCLTPGIRPVHALQDDQRRVVSPAQAVRAGSNFLVVGRPITAAPDPARAAEEILREMQSASLK
ncbi:MAG: orotidine-5'-phosphate decarboxylase, partial [Betaproteobacteria bacterium]|nr:orotidine-5'-phosphate decarboxylase [Betaproteobacteria bacterium]